MRYLNSIRARMTAAFALFIALLVLCACPALIWYAQRTADKRADRLLKAAARKIQREARDPSAQLSALLEDERDVTGENLVAMLVDAQGHILEKSQNRLPPWPHRDGDGWRVTTLPLAGNTVVIGLHWKRTEETVQLQTLTLSALSLLILLFATLGAWLLVGHTLSPIPRLSQQARAASADNLRVRLSPSSHDAEIVELVTTLNGLLARLEESAATRGRFYAAASHELRTPLQALSGHLELALGRPRTSEEYKTVVQKAFAQTQRLISLVRDLLLIHQLEMAPPLAKEPVDVADVCERCLGSFEEIIASKGLRVDKDLDWDIVVDAPIMHLEMLVRNLIENAVRYAESGGTVRVHSEGKCLTIFNACQLPFDWKADRLFEPFYRSERMPSVKTGGNGLGLAICKAIAEANAWTLSFVPEEGGVQCRVRF